MSELKFVAADCRSPIFSQRTDANGRIGRTEKSNNLAWLRYTKSYSENSRQNAIAIATLLTAFFVAKRSRRKGGVIA